MMDQGRLLRSCGEVKDWLLKERGISELAYFSVKGEAVEDED